MSVMLVTADTSHFDRSWLKYCARKNILLMSVTADTSHDPIGPFGPAGQSPEYHGGPGCDDRLKHATAAALSSALFWGANAAVTGTLELI